VGRGVAVGATEVDVGVAEGGGEGGAGVAVGGLATMCTGVEVAGSSAEGRGVGVKVDGKGKEAAGGAVSLP